MSDLLHFETRRLPRIQEQGSTVLRCGAMPKRYCVMCEGDVRRAVVVTRERDGAWFTICLVCAEQIAEAVEES